MQGCPWWRHLCTKLTPFSNLKSPLNKYLIELWQQWEWDEGLTRSCMKLIPNWMIVFLISHCMEHYYVAFVVVSSVVIASRERHFAIFVFRDTDVWISFWIIWFLIFLFIFIFLVTFLVWILTIFFIFIFLPVFVIDSVLVVRCRYFYFNFFINYFPAESGFNILCCR